MARTRPFESPLVWASVAVVAVLSVNAVIAVSGWVGGAGGNSLSDPPGIVVGSIWTLLFVLFGLALWALGSGQTARRFALIAFMGLCLAYPFYTAGLSDARTGLIGNGVTAAAALVLIVWFWRASRLASLLLIPVVAWLAFATWTILEP